MEFKNCHSGPRMCKQGTHPSQGFLHPSFVDLIPLLPPAQTSQSGCEISFSTFFRPSHYRGVPPSSATRNNLHRVNAQLLGLHHFLLEQRDNCYAKAHLEFSVSHIHTGLLGSCENSMPPTLLPMTCGGLLVP